MNYIIDGYNLGFKIKTCAELLRKGDTERAIPLILNFISGRISSADKKVIVVFDGKPGVFPQLKGYSGIQIKFSKAPQKADDIIRSFLRKLKGPGNWCSVSSDNEIMTTAKAMGTRAIKAEEFLTQQKKSADNIEQEHTEYKQKYDADNIDMNYWLRQFGEDKE